MRGVTKERLTRAMRLAYERAEFPKNQTPEEVWRGLDRATQRIVLEDTPKRVHPSSMPMPRSPDLFSPEELDEVLEKFPDILPKLAGCRVDTYIGEIGIITECADGVYRVKVTLTCMKCVRARRKPKPRTNVVYLSGGPHRGALCYAYDRNGAFKADLRNQEFVCKEHE